jgi:hypothetical protein
LAHVIAHIDSSFPWHTAVDRFGKQVTTVEEIVPDAIQADDHNWQKFDWGGGQSIVVVRESQRSRITLSPMRLVESAAVPHTLRAAHNRSSPILAVAALASRYVT